MPWRGPEYEGEFPSLGWGVVEWFAANFRVPDGPLVGEPLRLTDEQTAIVVRFYALDDRGRFIFRRGAVRRAQGWGKSPLLGAIALAELAGPVSFDGWDAAGEPVGVRRAAPWVQIAALSEDQADNTYAAVHAMAQESQLNGELLDVGITRIFLRGEAGRMEPVTSAAGTRLGQRVTFAVIDEPHLMSKRNGGHKLVATVRRNAGKMNGRTFESTNAHLPGEDTVAERTYQAHLKGAPGLLYDSREGDQVDDLGDREAVLASLRQAYGDSVAFVDVERIADEIADPATDPSDARRFYLNQLVGDVNDFVDVQAWDALGSSRAVAPGERIALGFDGSISDDATALWGCTEDLFLFPLRVWERPTDRGEWKVPRAEVHEEIRDAFDRYDVGLLVADPPKWWSEIEEWSATYGESRVESLDTNSGRRFAPICDRFATAVREGSLSHDGDLILRAHLSATSRKTVRANADAADGRTQFVIVKKDHRKIDAAVAACLALYGAEVMPEKTVHREVKARWI